jgi:2,3-bisphosphoglycerate-dependent phosphoglycerate mutase
VTGTLVLLRHGTSEWNELNLFTGWIDVPLSDHGIVQARHAGGLLARAGLLPDVAHTSVLTRAIQTANVALEQAGRLWVDVSRSWRLNERHYGALTGRVKSDIVAEYGEEQFTHWRRSSHGTPPPLPDDSPCSPVGDPRYAALGELPRTESLADVQARLLPYYRDRVVPDLAQGRTVLITSHSNALRALIKHVEAIGDDDIVGVNVPTGIPLVYRFDGHGTAHGDYLDPRAAAAGSAAVANEGKRHTDWVKRSSS